MRRESRQNANSLAAVAAQASRGDTQDYDAVPWVWSTQYDLRLQTVGISIGYDENARLACDLLQRMMDGESVSQENILTPPTGVVARRSTDTFASRDPRVTQAIRFMLGHFHEPITLADIAATTSVSRSILYVAFQDDVSKTPMEVLTYIRLNMAKQMLRETDRKVHVIAADCGFGMVANLYHHFKKSIGMTPTNYRKQSRA